MQIVARPINYYPGRTRALVQMGDLPTTAAIAPRYGVPVTSTDANATAATDATAAAATTAAAASTGPAGIAWEWWIAGGVALWLVFKN